MSDGTSTHEGRRRSCLFTVTEQGVCHIFLKMSVVNRGKSIHHSPFHGVTLEYQTGTLNKCVIKQH